MKVLLKEIREQRKISLKQLERKTNIVKSTLHRIETEKTSPNLIQLEKIAKGLKIRIGDLYESEYK